MQLRESFSEKKLCNSGHLVNLIAWLLSAEKNKNLREKKNKQTNTADENVIGVYESTRSFTVKRIAGESKAGNNKEEMRPFL